MAIVLQVGISGDLTPRQFVQANPRSQAFQQGIPLAQVGDQDVCVIRAGQVCQLVAQILGVPG